MPFFGIYSGPEITSSAVILSHVINGLGERWEFLTDVTMMLDDLPDVLLASVLHVRYWPRMLRRLDRLNRSRHRITIIGGNALNQTVDVYRQHCDAVAVGCGEVTMPTVIALLRDGNIREADGSSGILGADSPSRKIVRVQATTLDGALHLGNGRKPFIEVTRGCRRQCAFCTVAWADSHILVAPRDAVLKSHKCAGWRLNYLGPSVGDARYELPPTFARSNCTAGARKSVAVGIDGTSARLRAAIGKPRTAEDILSIVYMASSVKLYQIVGLPGETDEDNQEFAQLWKKILSLAPTSLRLSIQPWTPGRYTPIGKYPIVSAERYETLTNWHLSLPGGPGVFIARLRSYGLYVSDVVSSRGPDDGVEIVHHRANQRVSALAAYNRIAGLP
jgi:radical SAM superfamily enzyme YgiQ (UPF0313 family)